MEPDVDPLVDVGHGAGEEPGADEEHRHPDDDEGEAPRRHVEQGEEGGEEHQRAAEVADEDEHEHRGPPHHQHRPEVLQRRQRYPEDAAGADDQNLAVLAQVAGEKDDDRDLGELGRLEGERADLDSEVGAVDLLADPRQPRRQEDEEAADRDGVPVALEHLVVAQELDRQREEDEAEDEPVGLIAGEALVDPVDHHQPEGGQRRHQREQIGVGVGEADPQVDVSGDADRQKVGAVDEAEVAELFVLLRKDGGEARGEQGGDGNQGQELPVPSASQRSPSDFSMSSTRETASLRERSLWPVTASWRRAGRDSV